MTLPFPNPGAFGQRPKGMLDTWDRRSNLSHTLVHVRHVAPVFEPCVCALSAIFDHFSYFWPDEHYPPPNGPIMVCCLCMLVPMGDISRVRTGAPTPKELAKGEYGQICHFGTCGLTSAHHHAMVHADPWEPSTCRPSFDSHSATHRMLRPICKPSWRNPLGDAFTFGLFVVMSNHPFWDHYFSHQCGQLAA